VYSRELDGQVLTIAASGWTWNGLFVLQDLETGSLWWTGIGVAGNDNMVCIAGPLQDRQLPRLNYFRGLWRPWFEVHPQTGYLKAK